MPRVTTAAVARSNAGSDDEREHARALEGSSRRSFIARNEPERDSDSDEDDSGDESKDPVTLKTRQSLINVEHPFGLPIWKPALYKKSRTVTRDAEHALHSEPSAAAERHLLPGNLFWTVVFGWWLALTCFIVAAVLAIIPKGGRRYAWLVFGLGWYIAWPFGKYLEGDREEPEDPFADDDDGTSTPRYGPRSRGQSVDSSAAPTSSRLGDIQEDEYFPYTASEQGTIRAPNSRHQPSSSWNSNIDGNERTTLLGNNGAAGVHVYGTTENHFGAENPSSAADWLGRIFYWLLFPTLIAPLLLIVCGICWGLVVTIPMAKLNWELIKHMFIRPTHIRFCAAPVLLVHQGSTDAEAQLSSSISSAPQPRYPRLFQGQAIPSGAGKSTVLLCTYRAAGLRYYKYTVGGVNILFVNLMPVVFFALFDGLVLLPYAEHQEEHGKPLTGFLRYITSRAFIFILSLASVIPLSYFIGMAVASISAQSSIGMGAVINATFGSIIEIVLYGIMLLDGKGRLVEGSIIGSILAGVLLMPGASMCSSAVRRKEQTFNAKSAGVTSTMLIMAIIGVLTPTMFYQTYAEFDLVCERCPVGPGGNGTDNPWACKHCYYGYTDPAANPFYQSTVKQLAYFCAVILIFSYLIGLWFSLRTHASQIWQNPQQLLHGDPTAGGTGRMSIYHKLLNPQILVQNRRPESITRKPSIASTSGGRSASFGPAYTPLIESVNQAVRNTGIQPPAQVNAEEFTRAVAVATVSALRHQVSPGRPRHVHSGATDEHAADGGHGGHDAPNWSRFTSATVLLGCTALYAGIAEVLVDVVDVVLQGSGMDEKFLGITLFALVPNTTEFMNAMSFALNGNIALSMEIGSAYALQVCLLQIPAMVAFSAWYHPGHPESSADIFTLIFPRWDVLCIIMSVFLLTYTYIEAKSNYHRGSILILSYIVLLAGFYFAPPMEENVVSHPGYLTKFSSDLSANTSKHGAPSVFQLLYAYIRSLWP
ncbi:hypothetical protein BKA62DRAFT_697048 [Auriculariales sp. MPI-PUGE-AT-0066]|nr:hypothetical protein BKA62DRAFT_697048 [Auriculariales sp. MPI-PUGE-AT-0066]